MTSHITMISFNCEQNSFGDRAERLKVLRRLRDFSPALVWRQEMPGAADHAKAVMYEAEDPEVGLGMRGWLGERSATAVFADMRVFTPVAEFPNPDAVMHLPPTAVGLRLNAAGRESSPFIAVAGHLNYVSPAQREMEAGWLSSFNDKTLRMPDGSRRKAYMIGGFDGNSYPHQATPGDVPLPNVHDIGDEPHRAHRSRRGPDGTHVMDQEPHAILEKAGVVDVAHHLAQAKGHRAGLAPTMPDSPTHGPATRVDWVCASRHLLPAVYDCEVIDSEDESDHDYVVTRWDRDALADLLNRPPQTLADLLLGPAPAEQAR
ncbi:hypothetical protein ACH4GK_33290 [Streptomyces rimosus]|uniref:hypothetical protein n=1 Tax=Streptomyces rimosus TaxID=1927 RepID=UPI0004C9C2CB|nr:hypothetical protein [Streptomyces rimosus]